MTFACLKIVTNLFGCKVENLTLYCTDKSLQKLCLYSWFSADVISLSKLGFSHVGAHARCEIVCKSMPFLSAHIKSLQIIHIFNGYFPRKRPRITRYVDPAAIPSEQFSSECLPPIEVSDLLSYLVLEKSYYTNKQLKAFKSLEAYNQMVSGFVASVQGKEIAGKIVVVAKLRHSQE